MYDLSAFYLDPPDKQVFYLGIGTGNEQQIIVSIYV